MNNALIRCGAVTAALVLFATAAVTQESKPATTAPATTKPAASRPGMPAKAKPPVGATAENLATAYVGETNANARYKAFARKADEEGYGQVASLFRAVARAKEIQAHALSEVIKKSGGTPKADVITPSVKSTRENLEAALKSESYERDTLYRDSTERARADKNVDAVRVFDRAASVEAEYARFFQEALTQLDGWKTGKRDFYVCSVCGSIVTRLSFEKCPVCSSPKDKYEKVN